MAESYVRPFQKPLKNAEQLLQDNSVFIKDMRIEPFTPLMRTNNFLQNTLSRLLAYSPSERRMVKLKCDEEGRLAVYQESSGSTENRKYFCGYKTDVPNGEEYAFTTADRLLGNVAWPYTVPEGYKLYIRHFFVYGTSPAKWAMQIQVAGSWYDAIVGYSDSYDEVDLSFTIVGPIAAGTVLRAVVTNQAGTADFSCNAEALLEKEAD